LDEFVVRPHATTLQVSDLSSYLLDGAME